MTPREPLLAGEGRELTERERRTMTDPQRMIWRDDVEGICQSLDLCFDSASDRVRCGPCAIKQAERCGVVSDMTVANLPEVSRLRRVLKSIGREDLIERPTPSPCRENEK